MTDDANLRADEAEAAVLSQCLWRYDSIDRASALLTGDDFFDLDLGQLFDAAVQLRNRGVEDRSIDLGTVLSQVGSLRFRHVQDLQQLEQVGFASGSVEYHSELVKAAATRRAVLRGSARIRDAALTASTAEDALTAATQAWSDIIGTTAHGDDLDGGLWEDLASMERRSVDWVVPGYLNRGDRLVVTGGEGMGKSTFLRQIAIMTACGVNFVTGRSIPPKRVLVVDSENDKDSWLEAAEETIDTAKQMGLHPQGRLDLRFPGRMNVTSPGDLARLHRRLQQHQPDLLLIGPLYKLSPRGINNDDDAAPLITALDSIRDRGISICMETHMGHTKSSAGDRDVRPRGSAALLGWPEFGKGFAPARDPEVVQHLPQNDPLAILEWIPWRGDRHRRNWPRHWIRGGGKWPFTPFEIVKP